MGIARALSLSLTLRNTVPAFGIVMPVAWKALNTASPNVGAIPMTSPVERISGRRKISVLSNRSKGKTDSFTATYGSSCFSWYPIWSRVLPDITSTAILAIGIPVVLLTNGTVRDARGLTSITYKVSNITANWMFNSPLTFRALASMAVNSFISSCWSRLSKKGGSTAMLSPEWTPASSMCCIMPQICVCLPSDMASTSNSKASSKKRSRSTGCSSDAVTACCM